jgi:hypothetical protein
MQNISAGWLYPIILIAGAALMVAGIALISRF